LLHWKKEKDFVFEGPDWLEKTDFRDAFVFFDEEKNKFAMLLASRKKQNGPVSSKGVTVVAYSDDLYHWEVSKDIFFDPESYYTHECPDLFKMGDYYYLIFSEFTDRYQTTYRMSKSIHGPWVTPRVNTFDGHAFYAAKTASDGVKRYIFGWNPIKDKEQDEGIWQWGGNIIVHELVQDSDGLLYVKCPESVRNAYPTSCEILATRLIGTMKQVDDSLVLGNSYGRTIVSYGALPNVSKIEFDFEIFNDTGDFGIILNESRSVDNYYTVRFEPLFQRVAFDRWPRKERTQHTLTDVERYLPLTKGVKNHVTLLIQDSVLEVYVNDRVAMSTRMFDFRGNWGLYTQSTVVKFSSIRCNKE
jgi:beta-fructofuranosidase